MRVHMSRKQGRRPVEENKEIRAFKAARDKRQCPDTHASCFAEGGPGALYEAFCG